MPEDTDMDPATPDRRRPGPVVLGVLMVAGLLGLTWGIVAWLPPGGPDTQGDTGWVLGTMTGVLMSVLFGLLAVLGASRKDRSNGAVAWLVAGFGVYALVFVGLMSSYRSYRAEGVPELVLGLPAPTLWLLLGVWQLPWVLVVVFMVNYERWTLAPEDLAAFEALVNDRASAP